MKYTELLDTVCSYTQNYNTDFVLNVPTFVKQAEERIYNTVQIPALRKNVTGITTDGNSYLSCPSDFLSVFSLAVVDGTGNYEYLLNKDVNFIRSVYPNPSTEGLPKYYALFGPTVTSGTITNELSFFLGPTPDDDYVVELHYYYYPQSIVQASINTLGVITGGSGYPNGVYYNTPLIGGLGSGATATVTVVGNSVTAVEIVNGGSLYAVGDALSIELAGIGVGFSAPVASVNNQQGASWLGDNYSPALLYGTLIEAYIFMKGEPDILAAYEKKFQDALGQLNRLGTGLERGDAYRDGQAKIKVNP